MKLLLKENFLIYFDWLKLFLMISPYFLFYLASSTKLDSLFYSSYLAAGLFFLISKNWRMNSFFSSSFKKGRRRSTSKRSVFLFYDKWGRYILQDGIVTDQKFHQLILYLFGLFLENQIQFAYIYFWFLFEIDVLYPTLHLFRPTLIVILIAICMKWVCFWWVFIFFIGLDVLLDPFNAIGTLRTTHYYTI